MKKQSKCDAIKYFILWMKPSLSGATNKCIQPEKDCFLQLPKKQELQNETKPHFKGKFITCSDTCVGIGWKHSSQPLNLCSLYVDNYSPEFEPEKNYVGYVFGAIKPSDTSWLFNGDISKSDV